VRRVYREEIELAQKMKMRTETSDEVMPRLHMCKLLWRYLLINNDAT
jgi:hypothetical protein